MKSGYWSCSKFADWVRGMPKIKAGTEEEWDAWHQSARAKQVRYWLAESGLDYVHDFVSWPMHRFVDLRCYINNRWISKTHALTSNLKRGQWYDFDTRLLHSAFDELVDFVEIEQAWMHVVFSDEERKKYKTPWYRNILGLKSWRCPEAGLAYLVWASTLKFDGDWVEKDNPDFGKPTRQSLDAQETLLLYQWWKEKRPQRQDPMDISGWSSYCQEKRSGKESEEERKCVRTILDIVHKMEQQQEEEDTEMLIRLIKLRASLWT